MTARILIVEDDDIMRITVSDHLRNQGWETADAVDGAQALERQSSRTPALRTSSCHRALISMSSSRSKITHGAISPSSFSSN